ncbi:PREDICTED: CUB and sushi domain-containing protein 3-like, partial [Amphimedon queenslandica]|uniref:Sushi domain-containing protein n=3 Tax=Amphimedon queenslandica TaxID=400682 RepID=A0AAN0K1B1_AMPQE
MLILYVLVVCALCAQISNAQTCRVGNDYQLQSKLSNSNTRGRWFLNTAVPATCSGSINRYRVRYYDNNLNDGNYDIILAVWKPTNSNLTYEKDSATMKEYTLNYDDKRRRKRATNTFNTFDAVGVRKDSVIGVYIVNSKPLPVIGYKSSGNPIYSIPIGACVATTVASTSIINCTGSNQPTYVIHAETDITVVNCNTPPTVSNANYSQLDGDTEYGARVQYSCSTGYNINGNDTISCLLNASWSSPTPSCSLVDCGNPGEPANGYTNDNVFTYQSTVQYHCNEGYQLSGDSSIECTSNGNWNNTLPNCAIINCTDPDTPTNGTRNGTVFTFNSTVLYSCDTGYTITGASSLTCLSNGSWDASAPSCDIVNCSNPGTPTNGERFGSVFTYNAEVVYSCNEEYSLVGVPVITCQSNGYWSDALPSCVYIDCTDPDIPDNGLRTGSNFSFNSSVNFTCYPGYQLTGSDAITCSSDGKWSNDIPSCNITYCNVPMSPANGNVSYTSLSVNSSVYFTCDTGYTL